MEILSNQKIALRYFEKSDQSSMHEYFSDTDSSLYLARRAYQTLEKTLAVMVKYSQRDALRQHGKCIWVIFDNDRNEVAGCITSEQIGGVIILHIGIRKKCEGKGIASQVLKVAADYWLAVEGINKVVSYIDVEHLAAKSAFLKAGFSIVGTKESYYIAPQLSPQERTVYWLGYISRS
jgi:RimJ/RimL family protein N-acetyltransferase